MAWALHSVVINKHNYSLDDAIKTSQEFIKNKKRNFYRIDKNTYRFRNLSKQKFNEFRSHRVNDNISLVYGNLKTEYENLK